MEAVDPSNQVCFCDSFRDVTNDIADGVSTIRSAAANGH